MKKSVIITLLITIILTSFLVIGYFMSDSPQKIFALALAVWIWGLGIIISVLLESKTKKSIKIILLITSVLASLGIIYFASGLETAGLEFTVLVIGIAVGILSTLVERRSKSLFYSSVVITMVGWGIISVYQGYMHPMQLDQRIVPADLESFYAFCIGLFFHNSYITFQTLLSGPTIIIPYLQLSANIAGDFPEFIASIISFHGYKGIILALGWLNAYPELAAMFLTCMAGIRVALETFQAAINVRKNGIFNSLRRIKDSMVLEIVNTMPKVLALLLIAAVLETLWTQYWVNYWLQHIL